jgi:small subunit ribosomal protein S1
MSLEESRSDNAESQDQTSAAHNSVAADPKTVATEPESGPTAGDPSPEAKPPATPDNEAASQPTVSADSTTADSTAAESTSEESTPSAADDETQAAGETPEPSRQRVQLNPTVDQSQAKAIPSPSLTVTPATAESAAKYAVATNPAAEAATQATRGEVDARDTEMSGFSELEQATPIAVNDLPPVELPPVGQELDEALEAEIEAAMSSGALDTVAEAIHSPTDSAEQQLSEETLEEGMRLTGRIQSIRGDSVFLDLGVRSPAVVPSRQFDVGKKPEIGQWIEVVVDRVDSNEGLVLVNLPKGIRKVAGNWDAIAIGQIVDCMVTKTNKGGLEITVGNLRGFLPASQVDLSFVSDLEPYLGQKLQVKIIEVNRKKRNLVVSRRAYLQIERKEAEENLWKTIEVGQKFSGTVKTIKNYGAFVDIGGVDGFLHIGEMSWSRLKHPSELLAEGQQIEIKVLGLDAENKKISLGLRQLTQNPWDSAAEKYSTGKTVSGKVTRTMDFGAFVELEPGLEGLVHISELDYKRVRRVTDVLKVGQEVDIQILEVDPQQNRISLSLKALLQNPNEKTPDEDLAPGGNEPYQRKLKGPLKGGTGSDSHSGLFGNPKDFS